MSRRWSLAIAILLLIWLITAGCGGSKQSVAGRYLLLSSPEYYIDLKSNGEYFIGTTSSEPPPWGWEWPMSAVVLAHREGTWRLDDEYGVVLRSNGMERPFGEPRGNEITDAVGSVWQRQ